MKVLGGFGRGLASRRAPSSRAAHTGSVAYVIWILVALVTAAAVLLVVGATTDRDSESAWAAFRRGLRGRKHPDADQREAALAASADPVDLSLADFLRATASEGSGYLDPDELAEDLHRARERATHVLRPRREDATTTR